jgi:hypothetical protein
MTSDLLMIMPGGIARCENGVVAVRRKQLPCFFLTALAMCNAQPNHGLAALNLRDRECQGPR